MTIDTKVSGKMAKNMEKENFSTLTEGSYTLECGVTTFQNAALLKILVDMKPPSQQHTHYLRLVSVILYIIQWISLPWSSFSISGSCLVLLIFGVLPKANLWSLFLFVIICILLPHNIPKKISSLVWS